MKSKIDNERPSLFPTEICNPVISFPGILSSTTVASRSSTSKILTLSSKSQCPTLTILPIRYLTYFCIHQNNCYSDILYIYIQYIQYVSFLSQGFWPQLITEMKVNDFGLLNTNGDEWKELRAGVSPIFSLSKMKNMATAIDSVSQHAESTLCFIIRVLQSKNQTLYMHSQILFGSHLFESPRQYNFLSQAFFNWILHIGLMTSWLRWLKNWKCVPDWYEKLPFLQISISNL